MSEADILKITAALCKKFWFGGRATFPWQHPINKVKDALMIALDGSPTYKFKVHKNGKLRLMKRYSALFLSLPIKPLQTVTVDELVAQISGGIDKYSASAVRVSCRRASFS